MQFGKSFLLKITAARLFPTFTEFPVTQLCSVKEQIAPEFRLQK